MGQFRLTEGAASSDGGHRQCCVVTGDVWCAGMLLLTDEVGWRSDCSTAVVCACF